MVSIRRDLDDTAGLSLPAPPGADSSSRARTRSPRSVDRRQSRASICAGVQVCGCGHPCATSFPVRRKEHCAAGAFHPSQSRRTVGRRLYVDNSSGGPKRNDSTCLQWNSVQAFRWSHRLSAGKHLCAGVSLRGDWRRKICDSSAPQQPRLQGAITKPCTGIPCAGISASILWRPSAWLDSMQRFPQRCHAFEVDLLGTSRSWYF